MAVKLLNNGKRTIVYGSFEFHPKEVGSFTPEVAAKLLGLYKGEVLSLEEHVKSFEDAPVAKPAKAGAGKATKAKAGDGLPANADAGKTEKPVTA